MTDGELDRLMQKYVESHRTEIRDEYKRTKGTLDGRLHDEEIYETLILQMMEQDGWLPKLGWPNGVKLFRHALDCAYAAHEGQLRKGSGVPYISHLLAVAALVLEAGANEDTAIAALLHDLVEDGGDREALADIRHDFGEQVERIVRECSDCIPEPGQPKPEWWERKRNHIARLRNAADDTRLVVTADKLHNARSIVRDHARIGEELWARFQAGKAGVRWYYGEMLATLRQDNPNPLLPELEQAVSELQALGHGS